MEIIPAIDLKDGRCVRLYQGDFQQVTVYGDDPVAIAQHWFEQGAPRLHLVDLDGARSGQPVHTDIIRAIVRSFGAPVQLGGGLRSIEAVERALELGVQRVVLGTAAVEHPDMIAHLVAQFGDAIAVAIDARNGMAATAGWTETAAMSAVDLLERMVTLGVRRVIYTDISRDGTLSEPNIAATGALVRPDGPAIIASGGISTLDHLRRLADVGVEGAIVGRALYTGDLSLREALAAFQ
ncbi:1-(5-phosphoribosyl)-5-[(5-phosphoribosylamino)methylideneamino]imidazole-4-carboxamide isomerase [Roseiflexus castenholzii]|jgi:phosphoribosylformimino-5-aminoimidazole carboxamide ribotide isomerase|uniref:1-(5-phosphoribosyl)-5-[(5-phosphoribosylamino)methylideneamino] imidazole-4-carboxamide isomerase n=1 Tax=Roseiflexus castenholzii (strain DSM 13941 / HLO8) TaxID=383372 RepID=HIS4_ROSCS|nr:1-(5-phosphoribosyl)-5-[(5-phosphoribosylamino)methylideneamino]imidazole-4-carboxamide isomerase [Roseiflexus castenholzii]A7NN50.1 RecName: Full=1-(5-phosphoribosyl)-5-[(5-phosphoribosylamino)methylideneamino] imidazole-4-carboxamide isomerase; AltName: Full=Phosphoribosylformimino-5-aminoimidazole carboxamide ribotide isomerase [Roseiflexus castenholzii DSM 13941]ABU58982.1 phosphoribosylformimino-5-aminoimidazole carboxamide ribotide isomerase [Roseiflexus castenholzii DSM 13941]